MYVQYSTLNIALADTSEAVAEHSARLQPSINCMPQLQPSCSAALVPNVLPRRDEGSRKPFAVIEAS